MRSVLFGKVWTVETREVSSERGKSQLRSIEVLDSDMNKVKLDAWQDRDTGKLLAVEPGEVGAFIIDTTSREKYGLSSRIVSFIPNITAAVLSPPAAPAKAAA